MGRLTSRAATRRAATRDGPSPICHARALVPFCPGRVDALERSQRHWGDSQVEPFGSIAYRKALKTNCTGSKGKAPVDTQNPRTQAASYILKRVYALRHL